MSIKDSIRNKMVVVPATIGAATLAVPTLAFAEGETATVQSTVSNMATSVATDAQSMLTAVIPAVAPVVVAVIVATLGFRFVKKFSRG